MPGQGFWRVLSRILLLHDFRYDLPLSSKVNGEGEQHRSTGLLGRPQQAEAEIAVAVPGASPLRCADRQ